VDGIRAAGTRPVSCWGLARVAASPLPGPDGVAQVPAA